ncbi:MAG: outer membrane protein assembly factor BamD [Candidatus Eiseniibacteriota bacterium]
MTRIFRARAWTRRVLLAAALAALAGCGASTLPSVHSETERLALARRQAAKGDYADAIELLKTFIDNNAGSAEVDHAVYLLGDCYLHVHDWASAAVQFDRLLREFPESDSSAAAAFHLGVAYDGQARPPDFDQEYTVKAINQFRHYLSAYPGHSSNAEAEHDIQLARMKLATKLVETGDLYVKLHVLSAARIYYGRIEAEFSDLPQLGDAWVGLARCDVLEHNRDAAIEKLKQVEERFAGRPVADVAARERARLVN